jgi:exonuclease 3'-5' domain-containing protein 1
LSEATKPCLLEANRLLRVLLLVGLRKFLQQYPALFVVDGNYVNVNCYQQLANDDNGSAAGKKDYIQEAKDYFSQKLLQYGAGTEVPIKSLLGHRSQASPQVRHISGQHIKEFTDFLIKYPDTFRVVDELHVVLVNYDAATLIPQTENLHLPQPSIDVKFTQEILDFFAQCIEIKGPILVDQMFHLVTCNFAQERWYQIFKTPNDLTTFLKLFSDCFHVQSNLVTLLQKPKISENHIHHAEKVLHKNNLNQSSTPLIGDFKLNEPVSNNMMLNTSKTYKSESPSGNYNDDSLSNGRNSMNDLPSMGFGHSFHEIQLENLCPKNCPAKITYNHQDNVLQAPAAAPSPTPAPATAPKAERERERRPNLSLKQRISSLVNQTLAENEEKNRKSLNVLQPLNNGSITSSNSSSTATSPVHKNHFQGEAWRINVLKNTHLIDSVKESLFVCDAIKRSAQAPDEPVVISFDSKGVNIGVKGQLTIIEIGTVRGEAFIFDVFKCPELVTDGGLKTILEDENIIKVIHDCRNDSFNLFSQYEILLRNVFDTQVSFPFPLQRETLVADISSPFSRPTL